MTTKTSSRAAKTTASGKAQALDAFIARKLAVDELLARLATLSDEHFEVAPDAVNWGHVGNLGHLQQKLTEAVDFMCAR